MAAKKTTKKTAKKIQNKRIRMSGTWFVYFGIEGVIEGSRILTLKGMFDTETLLSDFSNHITASLTEEAQKVIKDSGNDIVIKNLVKIG